MEFASRQGLLVYVSGVSATADFSRGQPEPTFCKEVSAVEDGEGGHELVCGNHQALAWKAPRNIYARRGTLSFFWRSGYPAGPTEFPLFRVGFADSSSWDASWLRVDYNGHGFDAMVTDINLSRARVSCRVEPFPPPDRWVHLALGWDQDYGIRFYVNGSFAAEEIRPGIYDAGLDQFGPHGRAVSNWRVINDFNFIRGGSIKEIVIYDHMLSDENVGRLSRCECPLPGDGGVGAKADTWRLNHGFLMKAPLLPAIAGIRKVEIHDAYDLKRWYWKACDGIRETSWPGVHNRSRLKGRNDYFQLPDWDCYNDSGKTIVFTVPPEPFNWVEISGSAFGQAEYMEDGGGAGQSHPLFYRERGMERTVHRLESRFGGKIRFTNQEAEEPIGDFELLYADGSGAPVGDTRQTFRLGFQKSSYSKAEEELMDFIQGRYHPLEQNVVAASMKTEEGTGQGAGEGAEGETGERAAGRTEGETGEGAAGRTEEDAGGRRRGAEGDNGKRPFYQIVIPYEADENRGLDGVELAIPPAAKERGFSVQIKDPLWYYRNLMQVTFRTGKEGCCLWLDTRDRILPAEKCLYMTVACDDEGFFGEELTRWEVSLMYKDRREAEAEHCQDRFTQVRDLYGHMVEEAPSRREYNMFNRFAGDVEDLMRVNPDHIPGQYYQYEKYLLLSGKSTHIAIAAEGQKTTPEEYRPDYHTDPVPQGIPPWAYKQVEYLKHYKYIINWYVDHRQTENGEFGGGLSDDGDFTSCWVGLILMGCDREKLLKSLEKCNQAFYDQGMFTNGLCSIQADELHSAEEGIISLAQCCMADYGNPKFLERAMENARAGYWITGINGAGHRHFKSTYFNGSKMAVEEPWGWQDALSGLALCPSWYVARFNRNEKVMRLLTELADGLGAHYNQEEGIIYSHIRFEDDYAERTYFPGRQRGDLFLLYPAYRLTGNARYYDILQDKLKTVDVSYVKRMNEYEEESARRVDKEKVAQEYDKRCYQAGIRRYYNTEGSPWIDRVEVKYQEIQYDRLAGIGYERRYVVYPRNRVCWRFERDKDDERIAVLSPVALDDRLKLIICNISREPVKAYLAGGEITPGRWRFELGTDENDDDQAENIIAGGECLWARMEELPLTIPAGKTCILNMRLLDEGARPEYRCDLGISREDIRLYKHGLNVRVHSLGHIPSPAAKVALRDREGRIVRTADLPPLEAPSDLYPRTWEVIFPVYDIDDLKGYRVEIDPCHELEEITRFNNSVTL